MAITEDRLSAVGDNGTTVETTTTMRVKKRNGSLEPVDLAFQQMLDHRARFIPPVDEISQIHDDPAHDVARAGVIDNTLLQPLQQINAPMHITNRIDDCAIGNSVVGKRRAIVASEKLLKHAPILTRRAASRGCKHDGLR